MYRHRFHFSVERGHYNEFFKSMEKLNRINRERGWKEFRMWGLVFGPINHVVLETEYPDLATLEREYKAFQQDGEAMKVWREPSDIVEDAYDELWEEAIPAA